MTPGFAPDCREKSLARLRNDVFDILIVGGGINGAGIARDLALRAETAGEPLKLGLIDKGHFSSGTSGRNSQLIHGGLRYLKNLEFGLVREALEERATLLKIAPHLVEPLPLLLPFYGWRDRYFYGAGLLVYDILAGGKNIERRRFLTGKQVRQLEPGLSMEGLHSAAIYWDCKVNSARMTLENLFDAARRGLAAANYVEALDWRRNGDLYEIRARDRLRQGELAIRARKIVDARGPWEGSKNVRLVRGSHIVVPRLTESGNAIAHFGVDGRILFVIPWGEDNSLSLVGTTDVDHDGSADDVKISASEIRYIQAILRKLFPRRESFEPLAAYSALRPLVAAEGKSATDASRTHKIWLEDNSLLKITGGKYTTYRLIAEQAVDLLHPAWRGLCRTAEVPLGNAIEGISYKATAAHAVQNEMAMRLPDLLFVSTYWGHERLLTREILIGWAKEMGELLGWNEARVEEEIALTLRIAQMPA